MYGIKKIFTYRVSGYLSANLAMENGEIGTKLKFVLLKKEKIIT